MEYNSQREKLLLPEYGRNIQRMVQEALKIENRDERNSAARTIISVMASTNPNYKDVEDYNHKLWDHLYFISGYSLDIDSPYPKPEPEEETHPNPIPYPQKRIKYKHYGKNLEYFIDKAVNMEDPEMKDRFVEVLANLMKRHYLTWNRDSVNDELIKEHLEELSEGMIQFKDTYRLTSTNDILGMNKKPQMQNPKFTQNKSKGGKKPFKFNNGGKNKNNNGGRGGFNNPKKF